MSFILWCVWTVAVAFFLDTYHAGHNVPFALVLVTAAWLGVLIMNYLQPSRDFQNVDTRYNRK